MTINDSIVLVDEQNKALGTAPKLETHNENTPLHRGFSVFLFDSKGKLLLQQRSKTKKTFPLVWSNSCCGHPIINEPNTRAAKRRLSHELGIENAEIFEIISDYRYKVGENNIYENEICPILIAFTDEEPKPNSDEVQKIKWINWQKFIDDVKKNPGEYSMWCEEEAKLLEKNEKFTKLYQSYKK
jgi:isopentenyl-diphosphate Delta-isomerase